MTNIFNKKKLHFGCTSGPSYWFLGNKNFSGKSTLVTFFLFLDLYCCAEFQKQLMNWLNEKLVTSLQKDGHMQVGRHRTSYLLKTERPETT